ncbi:MAG TPA: ferredoxin family protein [Planctomycetota bacterium]|nr:ferredoxin family protein [Planctomycetota bacterium]
MPHVVTENCRDCKFTSCVRVCPVDCFSEDDRMLYIDPTHCIDCRACIQECPVHAIYPHKELPAHLEHWRKVNEEMTASGKLAPINVARDPLPTAEAKRAALGFANRDPRAFYP